ncbi:hypothetical protein [Streptomyces sp. NPDC090036]|uniref:hypothetical protein n=1 Tax=Streptomyces sp. NPDC090036 TaxID=3365926 RepID=UPI00380B33A6
MVIDNFPLFRGHTFAESFQARNNPFKQTHDIPRGRLEYPLVDKKDHLGHMFVSESQVAMNERQVLTCAQQILAAA